MKKTIFLVWLLVLICNIHWIPSTNIYTLTEQYGFPLETYYVTTPDGYILRLFRINHRDDTQSDESRPVILMQHGMIGASEDYLSHGPDLSPAFFLVENGYDVWLSNARGNRYSRNHTTLDPDSDPEFWRFTTAEMGYDLQINIEFVLNFTSAQSLTYIGYSQSTSIGFTALWTNNSWFEGRVNLYVAIVPLVRLDYITSPVFLTLFNSRVLLPTLRRLGVNEFFTANFFSTTASTVVCSLFTTLWNQLDTYAFEGDPSVDDLESIRVYTSHAPAGAAMGYLEHIGQIHLARRFQYFDYGPEENQARYNSTTPPEMDPASIRNVPIAIFNGRFDLLSDIQDVNWLAQQLSNVLVAHNEYDYGHLTFLIGRNMTYLDDMLAIINQYAQAPAASG